MKIEKQGKDGEKLFQKWLDDQKLGYLRIEQDKNTLPVVFRDLVKRPDFLLLLPSIGFIAIDVKNYTPSNTGFTLAIDKEIEPAISFEHYTRLYLWYAYRNKDSEDFRHWSFISAHRAMDEGVKKRNRKSQKYYLDIDQKHFTEITCAEDLGNLFSTRIGIVGKFARAIEHSFREMK